MNILYIGAFPPDSLVKQSDGKIDSLYRDDQAIIAGLRALPDIQLSVITSPDIPSWPNGPLFLHRLDCAADGLTMVSSLNISLLKQLWTIMSMVREANRTIMLTDDKVVVVIPYLVFRHVVALRLLHLLHPKKVLQACVVPDIFFPSQWLLKIVNHLTERIASKFDAFVLYTKKMAEYLHLHDGHYEVIEGFREVLDREPSPTDDFRIVYAGSLNLAYGIGRLLDAMELIDDSEIQLHLYGAGTAESMIMKRCDQDSRVFFHGRVPNAIAVEAIYSASVLINPRNAYDGEYTEYSFPSKDIEYMATGIPSLLCRLPGMPSEYLGHFIDLGDGRPDQIAEAIKRVKRMTCSERDAIGKDARSFIRDRMDCTKQGLRIATLFNRIINKGL